MVEVQDLFNLSRFASDSFWTWIALLLYAPAGVVLFILRVLFSIQYMVVLSVLPKGWLLRRIIMRIYYFAMGLFVTSGGQEYRDKNVKILVSNHVSCLDSIAMEAIEPAVRITSQSDLPPICGWLLGFDNTQLRSKDLMAVLPYTIQDDKFPFACFPEEESTNGHTGLLKFKTWPCKLKTSALQPVVIYGSRPWFTPVNISYIQSSFWSDLFWLLFVPFTHFHIGYLPKRDVPEDDGEESCEEFMKSVQKDIAYVLQLEQTNFTAQDKSELLKRLRHEELIRLNQQQTRTEIVNRSILAQGARTSPLETMVQQVKAVMPQVPLEVIRADLGKTKSVDTTLANILEGSVAYVSLSEAAQVEERLAEREKEEKKLTVPKGIPQTRSILDSSKERHLSFQERKKIMIAEAQKRYIERNPMYEVA